jgi:quercetin dioxygenase-like cupin family protein
LESHIAKEDSMSRHLIAAVALSFGLAACGAQVPDEPSAPAPVAGFEDEGPGHHLTYQPGEIPWQDAPASLEPGAQVALLEGNPAEEGVFTMRIRMPDGYHIAPHWHPNVERVTVISGRFLLGAGEELDREAAQALEAGSYTSMPPGMRHFAIADGETVVQITSVGPWDVHYVNAEDDPRLRD